MLIKYLKNEISIEELVSFLNDELSSYDLVSFTNKIKELGNITTDSLNVPTKLSLIHINEAIISNNLHIYETDYFNKFVLQDMVAPYDRYPDFIDDFCGYIKSCLDEIYRNEASKKEYLDNIGLGTWELGILWLHLKVI